MLIRENHLAHWLTNFYGYGSWSARMWFIGYEEGGGDLPEEVAEKFNYFYEVHPPTADAFEILCDIRELYKRVTFRADGPRGESFATFYEYRFGPRANKHGIWKNLISFIYGYRNQEPPDLLDYQKNVFALPDREALIPLYPLPSTHNHAWYYSWLDMPQFPFLKSRALYEDHVYQRRMRTILQHINTYKPEVVLMYGMDNINTLKKSIQEFYDGVTFKMVKATKGQIPQYHRADFNGTTLLITTQVPALRHNRIETGFDWQAFGNMVKAET